MTKTFSRPSSSLPDLMGKLPPASLESECALLGAMILNHRIIPEVMEIIRGAGDFTKPGHSDIYEAVTYLHERNIPVDIVHLTRRLEDVKKLDGLGGVDYLVMLAESVPSTVGAVYYAKAVREIALKRQVIESAHHVLHRVYNDANATAFDLIEDVQGRLSTIGGEPESGRIMSMEELIAPAYQEINERAEAGVDAPMGFTVGFPDIDEVLGGLELGTVTIIGARTSDGKTALAQQWAEHIASSQAAMGCLSLEMAPKQLAYRLLAGKSGVGNNALRRPTRLKADQWSALNIAYSELLERRIYTAVKPGCSLPALVNYARRMKEKGVKGLVIDHLGLMRPPKAENRNLALGELTSGIKALALEMQMFVILLCQLSRMADGQRPSLIHLRESGHIEEDADNVGFIWRPDKGKNVYGAFGGEVEQEKAVFVIAKNRQGPLADIDLTFFPKRVCFGSVDNRFGRTQ